MKLVPNRVKRAVSRKTRSHMFGEICFESFDCEYGKASNVVQVNTLGPIKASSRASHLVLKLMFFLSAGT
jgi:hypothetical protein